MAGTITHSWNGTILTVTSDSGTSSADLKGDTGCRGPQGPAGVAIEGGGGSDVDLSAYYTSAQVETRLAATAASLATPAQVSQIVTAQTSGFVTEAEVDNKIANADLDLAGYATEAYVATEIAKAQLEGSGVDTSQFATKTDITNIATNYATKDYVTQEIANASIGGGTTDLTNYATKAYVDGKFIYSTADLPTGSGLTTGVIYLVYE